MKVAAVLCLLLCRAAMADGGHPDHLAPMPPDPVMVNRVPCAHTCASLEIRKLSQPGDLFLWELLKDTTTLSTPQVRTLALELLRVRRFYDDHQPTDAILLCAWSERDPAAAAREVVNIPDWEDRDDAIGDYDSDVEYFGIRLWNELARTDFAAARKIAASLKGHETSGQFFSGLSHHSPLSSTQAVEICKLAQRLTSPAAAQELASGFLRDYLDAYELAKARAFPVLFPKGPIPDSLERSIFKWREWEAAPDDPFVFPPIADPELCELKKLDIIDPGRFAIPFALLRKVLAFTPEQALARLEKLAPPQRPEGWMLLMRAMEGDATAAAAMQFSIKLPNWIYVVGTLPGDVFHAHTAAAPGKQEALRAMSAEERAGALTACMSRVPLEQAREWLAFAREVKAPALASQPLLVRLAASGKVEAALEAVPRLTTKEEQQPPRQDSTEAVFAAWALQDFPAAGRYFAGLADKTLKSLAERGIWKALNRLGSREMLEKWPDELSLQVFENTPQFFVYLAHEDRQAGFQFLERHRSDPSWPYLAGHFANSAIRYDPDRVLKLIAGTEVDREWYFRRIAVYWPKRLQEFLRPDSDEKIWAAVAADMAHARPDSLLETLRGVEFTSVWDTAGGILGFTRPDLMKKIAPRMSEAERYRVMVERRR